MNYKYSVYLAYGETSVITCEGNVFRATIQHCHPHSMDSIENGNVTIFERVDVDALATELWNYNYPDLINHARFLDPKTAEERKFAFDKQQEFANFMSLASVFLEKNYQELGQGRVEGSDA